MSRRNVISVGIAEANAESEVKREESPLFFFFRKVVHDAFINGVNVREEQRNVITPDNGVIHFNMDQPFSAVVYNGFIGTLQYFYQQAKETGYMGTVGTVFDANTMREPYVTMLSNGEFLLAKNALVLSADKLAERLKGNVLSYDHPEHGYVQERIKSISVIGEPRAARKLKAYTDYITQYKDLEISDFLCDGMRDPKDRQYYRFLQGLTRKNAYYIFHLESGSYMIGTRMDQHYLIIPKEVKESPTGLAIFSSWENNPFEDMVEWSAFKEQNDVPTNLEEAGE